MRPLSIFSTTLTPDVILTGGALLGLFALVILAFLSADAWRRLPIVGLLAVVVGFVAVSGIPQLPSYVPYLLVFPALPFLVKGMIHAVHFPSGSSLAGAISVIRPPRMLDDESATVTMVFGRTLYLLPYNRIILRNFQVPVPGSLTATLQAAGFEVEHEATQKAVFSPSTPLPITGSYAEFHWNLFPKSSGAFEANLLVIAENGVGRVQHRFPIGIQVSTFLRLRKRHWTVFWAILFFLTAAATVGRFYLQYQESGHVPPARQAR